jgi:hypothetical protein
MHVVVIISTRGILDVLGPCDTETDAEALAGALRLEEEARAVVCRVRQVDVTELSEP